MRYYQTWLKLTKTEREEPSIPTPAKDDTVIARDGTKVDLDYERAVREPLNDLVHRTSAFSVGGLGWVVSSPTTMEQGHQSHTLIGWSITERPRNKFISTAYEN